MCRKVQVERPRASTSGGQSAGRGGEEERGVVAGEVGEVSVEEDSDGEVSFFVMAAQAAMEVQERHLRTAGGLSVSALTCIECNGTGHGSGYTVCHLCPIRPPSATPFWSAHLSLRNQETLTSCPVASGCLRRICPYPTPRTVSTAGESNATSQKKIQRRPPERFRSPRTTPPSVYFPPPFLPPSIHCPPHVSHLLNQRTPNTNPPPKNPLPNPRIRPLHPRPPPPFPTNLHPSPNAHPPPGPPNPPPPHPLLPYQPTSRPRSLAPNPQPHSLSPSSHRPPIQHHPPIIPLRRTPPHLRPRSPRSAHRPFRPPPQPLPPHPRLSQPNPLHRRPRHRHRNS